MRFVDTSIMTSTKKRNINNIGTCDYYAASRSNSSEKDAAANGSEGSSAATSVARNHQQTSFRQIRTICNEDLTRTMFRLECQLYFWFWSYHESVGRQLCAKLWSRYSHWYLAYVWAMLRADSISEDSGRYCWYWSEFDWISTCYCNWWGRSTRWASKKDYTGTYQQDKTETVNSHHGGISGTVPWESQS